MRLVVVCYDAHLPLTVAADSKTVKIKTISSNWRPIVISALRVVNESDNHTRRIFNRLLAPGQRMLTRAYQKDGVKNEKQNFEPVQINIKSIANPKLLLLFE